MTTKTNKSFTKRLKVTKKGKVMRRQAGKNHFNAKENRKSQMKGNRPAELIIRKKSLDRFIPNN